MAIFVILPKSPEARSTLLPVIEREFPRDNIALASGAWLVSAPGTSEEVAARLEILGKPGISAIVFTISGYYGRAPTNVWEWLKEKLESGAGV